MSNLEQITRPFGSWKSPLTSDLIASATIGFGQIFLENEDTYWIETRPKENGRHVIVKRTAYGTSVDLAPEFYARTRVHEYGGGAYTVADGVVYFSNYVDQNIYKQQPGASPVQLSKDLNMRYADAIIDRGRKRLICVREDHCQEGLEPQNSLVSLSTELGDKATVLHSGYDFYSSPRLSPNGSQLAWIAWRHPNMPWDGTELWLGEIDERGQLHSARCVAGSAEESILQPEWSPEGQLYFISDRSDWWNLYRLNGAKVEPIYPMSAEFARPHWHFGYSCYAFVSANKIIATFNVGGIWQLALIDCKSNAIEIIDSKFTDIMWLKASGQRIVFRGGSPTMMPAIVQTDLIEQKTTILKHSSNLTLDAKYISIPKPIQFPTDNDQIAHAFFYPAKNDDYGEPKSEKPPVIVKSHGGPTGSCSSTLNLSTQFWTSRGFAVLDVNYGGSSGYGRKYRERLNGKWGVVDVNDCINALRYLTALGQVDSKRTIISGESAGGYTTLACLTFTNNFCCGASYYGISNLESMARDTHKFESRYLDNLIGPYPKESNVYKDRSPIYHIDKLKTPIIFFQGLEDLVVPPNQAQMMVDALRKKNIPVAYMAFAGEQHGFRRADTIKLCLDAELYFYAKVLSLTPADQLEAVPIDNLR